jgi:D-Tyr-tRNAtyr deacylase
MRVVVQRVSHARVIVDGTITGEIADGLLVLLGVGREDTSAVATGMAEKISNLRILWRRPWTTQAELCCSRATRASEEAL